MALAAADVPEAEALGLVDLFGGGAALRHDTTLYRE